MSSHRKALCAVLFVAVFLCGADQVHAFGNLGLVGGGASSGSSGVNIPNYTKNGGLPKLQACRQKVIVNSPVTNCKVLIIGDSTPAGYGASFNAMGSDARAFSWPTALAAILSKPPYNLNSSATSILGSANAGTIGAYTGYDTRANAGTWSLGSCTSGPCFGGSSGVFDNTDATSAFAFNPADSASFTSNTVSSDTLDVIALTYSGAGTLNISVNGGSTIGSINLDAANSFVEQTFSTTLGANTWDLKCSANFTAGCLFLMVRSYNSAQSEVSILNAGWSGSKTGDWVNTGNTPWDPLSTITKIAPTACIIDLLINDEIAGTATATVSTNSQTLITQCKNAGADVLLVSPEPISPASVSYATQQTYMALYRSLATSNNIPLLDVFATLCGATSGATCPNGGWNAGMGAGWNASAITTAPDVVHMSVAGYTPNFAEPIAQVLMQ